MNIHTPGNENLEHKNRNFYINKHKKKMQLFEQVGKD